MRLIVENMIILYLLQPVVLGHILLKLLVLFQFKDSLLFYPLSLASRIISSSIFRIYIFLIILVLVGTKYMVVPVARVGESSYEALTEQ
jgi:hypothetical protein